MWYTSWTGDFPNGGIGFAYSSDGLIWTKHSTAVMTPGAAGWMAVWWVPLIVFLLFCFRRHRILIFGKTKPQIRLEDSTLDTGLGDPSSLLRWVKVEGSHHL